MNKPNFHYHHHLMDQLVLLDLYLLLDLLLRLDLHRLADLENQMFQLDLLVQ
jgi:hypothetical protein